MFELQLGHGGDIQEETKYSHLSTALLPDDHTHQFLT